MDDFIEKEGDDNMAEHVGLVLNTFENKTAEVVTDRRDACSGCAETHNCRTCLTSSHLVSTVQNPIGARQGDVVSIYLEDSALWTGALLLYIIPVLWLLTGAIIGSGLGADWKIGETGGAILFGLSGFAVGLAIIVIISRSLKFGQKITPRITRVIEHPSEGEGKFRMPREISEKQL